MAKKLEKIYPWIVVGLLWVVALLNYMDRQMLSTMREFMAADIAELNQAEAEHKHQAQNPKTIKFNEI